MVDVDEAAFEAYELVAADVRPLLVARERYAVGATFADSNPVSG